MPLPNRDFIYSYHSGCRIAHPSQFLPHVVHFHGLGGSPIQVKLVGHFPDRSVLTPFPDIVGKPFRVKRVVPDPGKAFCLHGSAVLTINPADFHFQIDPQIPAGLVSDQSCFSVVECARNFSTGSTNCFFPLRWSRMIRAYGSPNNPLSMIRGMKPGNR